MEVVKVFVTDTVGLARYLEDNLPDHALYAFGMAERGEGTVLVPQIVVGEFIYIALKGRLKLPDPKGAVKLVMEQLRGTSFINLSDFPGEGWNIFLSLDIPELHDRLIAAESLARNAPLISNDPVFRRVQGLETIWE